MLKLAWLVIFFLPAAALAQHAGYKPLAATDAFRSEFVQASSAIRSIKSDFVQEKNLSMLSDKIISTGHFWFKRENKVRMEYDKPSYYLIVINGDMIKTKDAQRENHVSSKSNKMFEQVTRMMVDCMQGTMMDNKSFTSRVFANAGSYLLEMTPTTKTLQGIFKSISLVLDKKNYQVDKLEMVEQSGDNTVISFTHRQTNVDIPDDLFSVK